MGAHKDSFGTLDFRRNPPLFRELEPRELEPCELEAICAAATEHRATPGTVLFRRGDRCDGFHVIVLGRVKLALLAPAGAEKVVEILGPGQSFGEPVMFIGRPHMLYAEALADSLLLFIHESAILQAIERNPAFAQRMLHELSQAGLIRASGRGICILDPPGLRDRKA